MDSEFPKAPEFAGTLEKIPTKEQGRLILPPGDADSQLPPNVINRGETDRRHWEGSKREIQRPSRRKGGGDKRQQTETIVRLPVVPLLSRSLLKSAILRWWMIRKNRLLLSTGGGTRTPTPITGTGF